MLKVGYQIVRFRSVLVCWLDVSGPDAQILGQIYITANAQYLIKVE